MVRFVRLDLPHGYSNGYGYLFENDVAILKLMRLTQLMVVLRDHDADIVNSGGGVHKKIAAEWPREDFL
jgi:hypothetical protein